MPNEKWTPDIVVVDVIFNPTRRREIKLNVYDCANGLII